MADTNDPFFGKIGDANKALDALLQRIRQAEVRVSERERAASTAVPPPQRAGVAEPLGAAATGGQNYKKVLADIERLEAQATGRTALYSEELRRQIQLYGTSSNALRKHGALTTEFLNEAAKGRVTLSELRYQVGATILKFAGWTAAAAAVYGVVGVLRQVGTGAVEASTGVNQLQRVLFSRTGGPSPVNQTAALEGFRKYSRQFNLPIGDVAAAQYQIGKVFQSQSGSYKATEALLYAVKVGELSVVDASRLLISTVNAFGLQFGDLLPLMDKYNSLQNSMGVATRDTAAGVAKAAGQWRAAGGSLRYLVALVGAGTKVTGLSGEQFGTLLQRSAGLTQRPLNQQALRGYGIDPRQDIEEIIRDAFQVAKTLPRRQLLGLATALSTPQLAPRYTALLNRPDIVARAEHLTDPRVAAGSSARELNTVLGSFQERMKRITTDLQQVGEGFAVSGALTLPGTGLVVLDQSLRLISDITGAFSHLNPEARVAIATLTQVMLIMRLMRRFNVGDTFAQAAPVTAGLFRQSPERRARTLISGALQREQGFYIEERERVARQSAVQQRRALASAATSEALVAQGPAAFGGNNTRYRNALASQQADVVRQTEIAAGLANEEAALRAEIDASQKRSNAFQQDVIRGQKTALAFAAEQNIVFPAHLGLPTTDPLVDPRAGVAAVTAQTSRASRIVRTTGTALGELKSGVQTLGSALLGGLFSPLGLLITATTAIPLVVDYINQRNKQLQDELDRTKRLRVRPIRTEDLPKAADQAREAAGHKRGLFEDVKYAVQHPFSITRESRLPNPIADAGRAAEDELRSRYISIRAARAFRQPARGLAVADIVAERDRAIAEFQAGAHTKAEREKALARILREYDLSIEASRGSERDLALVHRSSARTRREFGDLGKGATPDLYAGLGLDDISKRVDTYVSIAGAGRNVDANFRKAVQALEVARTAIGPASAPENINSVLSIQSAIANGINDQAKQELDHSLAFAHTDSQRRDAYRRYEASLRRRLVHDPRRSVREAQDAADAVDKQLANAEKDLATLGNQRRVTPAQVGAAQTRVRRLKAQDAARHQNVEAAKQIEQAFARFFQIFFAGIQQDLSSLADTTAQNAEALSSAQDALYVAGASGPLDKAQRNLQVLYRKLGRERRGKHTAADLVQTQADIVNAQHDLADQALSDARDLINARAAYAAAGVDDPLAAARIEARRARQQLARGGFKSPAERLQARADVRRSGHDVVRTREQEAYDDIQFLADVGRISQEEERRRLRRLLTTIKFNKDLKRQILRDLHGLNQQDDSSLDLNIGSLRLPTLYDVRRLAQRGAAGDTSITQHNQYTFHVARGTDMQAFGAELESVTGGHTNAALRSAGLI